MEFTLTNVIQTLLLLASCAPCISAFVTYKSCSDVKAQLGTNATNDEYVITLNNGVGISLYCAGMTTNNPKEYLTLRAGPNNNFAMFYNIKGSNTSCADATPKTMSNSRGRTQYLKVRINPRTLSIDTSDTTFTKSVFGPNKIRYANAGDNYASSSQCPVFGTFKIDFQGTPLVVSSNVQWTWTGQFVRGNIKTGVAHITNTSYIGCYIDANDRLLPSAYKDSAQMTPTYCINFCNGRGFRYAGVQYYTQCFCGDNIAKHDRTAESQCNARCRGNSKYMCGGTWRVSVYNTGLPQAITGKCGGYPGRCFPALQSNRNKEQLALSLISTHPCFGSKTPCKNEGRCIATTATDFKCQCYEGYSGILCDRPKETIVLGGASCPAGMQAEKCECSNNRCTGARFDGDTCVTTTQPKVVCRPGDPGHVILFNVKANPGERSVTCPAGSQMTGCSYWDASHQKMSNGQPDVARYQTGQCSVAPGCQKCTLHARCKKYDCGCKNNGHCHQVTGECVCLNGYYGTKCENFDYCSFYANQTGNPACGTGGQCTAVPMNDIMATRGNQGGSSQCIFPFTYNGTQFGGCVNNNQVGPPFACASKFDGTPLSHIDLGQWSPGSIYTIATWVRPGVADGTRRTIVGGVGACRDFGIYHFQTFWAYYKGRDGSCTRGINSGVAIQIGEWYLLAVVANNTHITFYVNGKSKAVEVYKYNWGTTKGFWIGGEECCPSGRFVGMIKNVKVWKRALQYSEIYSSMNTQGNQKSMDDAANGGLVGYWELGETLPPQCNGQDHGGADWIPSDGDILSGTHCNISRFYIPKGVSVLLRPYNKTTDNGGLLDILAQDIEIQGVLDGSGAGYAGGPTPSGAGSAGIQGDSYTGRGAAKTADNRGGGGGGAGGNGRGDQAGKPGGGGGYGSPGKSAVNPHGDASGLGGYGKMYGDATLHHLYLGSGGGSGGNAQDITSNPLGGLGGNGGGAIRLRAQRNVVIGGYVSVSGADGHGDAVSTTGCLPACPKECSHNNKLNCYGNSTNGCWDYSGPGGGGSGGSLFISGKVVNVGQRYLYAMGGSGGYGTKQGCGGDGGLGRIRVESVILKGTLQDDQGVISTSQIQNQYTDHSYEGQIRINYKNTLYGNEVYLGCFKDADVTYRVLSYAVPLTGSIPKQMTPHYCMTMCRAKGYKYSGTEYGKECFCDNHLDMTKKTNDADCQMRCTGDNQQTCGASFRIQVFGPHPGASGMGHKGAVQTCEPWCVTADIGTRNPKWGTCQLQSSTVTLWKTLCQCPAGQQGDHCDQKCDLGFFGNDCALNCTCNMTNTATCHPVTGKCLCKPGYTGDDCQSRCPVGTYGMGCKGVCNCSQNADCDMATGACICAAGFTGPSCKFPCPIGYFGRNCSDACPCNGHGSCDPVFGTCNCDPGYTNQFCGQSCDPGSYGINCEKVCDCNFSPCDPVTGACSCKPGKSGKHCNRDCPWGMYGNGCNTPCGCVGSCDPVSGQCYCPPGSFGQHCEFRCASGTYGKNCQTRCSCVTANTQICDPVNGLCNCKPGFTGHKCEITCPVGTYGLGCNMTCSQCQHGASCDPNNGSCICPPGFQGNNCEIPCTDGYYGNHCTGRCASCGTGTCSKATGLCICQSGSCSKCPRGFYGSKCTSVCNCLHGECNIQGTCQCDAGWQGSRCDTPCPKGKYGVNCQNTCACARGICHTGSGYCVCPSGYSGINCDTPCKNFTYGPGCINTCSQCIHGQSCNPVSGSCACAPGYTGILCDQKCTPGNYGQNCAKRCNCQNGALCNNVDGSCTCGYGYRGTDCSQKCPINTFGMNCSQACVCGSHSNGCDPESGKCYCTPGYQGEQCEHSCRFGSWGPNCERVCYDVCSSPGTDTCSPIDGTCRCKPGYRGTNCSSTCPPGTWGRNCINTCSCNNRGICDVTSGVCECDPGYNGTHCETSCSTNGRWGKRCNFPCKCNGAPCNPVDGRCECPAGKKGHHCEQECNAYYFGFNCAQPCRCQNGAICNKVSGACQCQPGWAGVFCDSKCDDGYYGSGCNQQCPVCLNGGSCNPSTGVCQCSTGYTGTNCNQTCPEGTWGENCVMTCSAMCLTGCQPHTGVCNCSPTSCLNGGVCSQQGTCHCKVGFEGDDCSRGTGQASLARAQTQTRTNAVSLSGGSVAGIAVGIILLIILVAVLVVLGMKKYYTGRFLRSTAAVRYERDSNEETHSEDGMHGFSNPQYEETKDITVLPDSSKSIENPSESES